MHVPWKKNVKSIHQGDICNCKKKKKKWEVGLNISPQIPLLYDFPEAVTGWFALWIWNREIWYAHFHISYICSVSYIYLSLDPFSGGFLLASHNQCVTEHGLGKAALFSLHPMCLSVHWSLSTFTSTRVMPAGWVWGPRGRSRRTRQEGPWLHADEPAGGENRHLYWRCRESRYRQTIWETQKGNKEWVPFLLGVWGFTEEDSLIYMSSQASRNWLKHGKCPSVLCKSFMPWSQGFWHQGVWSQWSWKIYMTTSLLRCYVLSWKTPEKLLTPRPLQEGNTLSVL